MTPTYAPPLERMDRRVLRGFVRAGRDGFTSRIDFSLQEALRLAELPYEREGRIYCFRRVALQGIEKGAGRAIWNRGVQEALSTIARSALHAGDVGASRANAVYFDDQEQALELLLRAALSESSPTWFAVSILGKDVTQEPTGFVASVVQHMMDTLLLPAVAEIVFNAVEKRSVLGISQFLQRLPESSAAGWLSRVKPRGGTESPAKRVTIAPAERELIVQIAGQLGWSDSRVLWFSVLLVQTTQLFGSRSPSDIVAEALAELRSLEKERATKSLGLSPHSDSVSLATRISFFEREEAPRQDSSIRESLALIPTHEEANLRATEVDARIISERRQVKGKQSSAAGLLFVLQALRYLGIEKAMESTPVLLDANLAVQVIANIAWKSGVHPEDPILASLGPYDEGALQSIDELDCLPITAWPITLRPERARATNGKSLMRAWTLALRRWLRRNHQLSLSQLAQRDGMVRSTRTDIDVTFPLKKADVQIRRAGLDIDPGWLPWLGPYGRVVRFHYSDDPVVEVLS